MGCKHGHVEHTCTQCEDANALRRLRTRAIEAEAEIAALKSKIESLAMLGPWSDAGTDDQDLPEEDQIHAAHPVSSGRHDLFIEAMRLVRAKRSKYGLIGVITWLLLRQERAIAAMREMTIKDCATFIEEDPYSQRMSERDVAHDRVALAARMLSDLQKGPLDEWLAKGGV